MKRIAKFEKVSLTQFKAGCTREDAEKVYEGIKLPKRATAGSAGYDFYAPFDIELKPGETANIPTGTGAYRGRLGAENLPAARLWDSSTAYSSTTRSGSSTATIQDRITRVTFLLRLQMIPTRAKR